MRVPGSYTGKRGEEEACRHLQSLGHRILARNWRYGHLEIDIISLAGDGLHFVEVKSLTAPAGMNPVDKVGIRKQKKIAAAATAFLHSESMKNLPDRTEAHFDVVSVVINGADFEIEYFPQAFIPTYV